MKVNTTRVALTAVIALCGCGPEISGLRPTTPKPVSFCPKVQTLEPILQWETFPQPRHLARLECTPDQISNVSYDLRLWEISVAGIEQGPPLTVSQVGLTKPEFPVHPALRYDTTYCWTIRARFKLDGDSRMTQWTETVGDYPAAYEVTSATALRFTTPRKPRK